MQYITHMTINISLKFSQYWLSNTNVMLKNIDFCNKVIVYVYTYTRMLILTHTYSQTHAHTKKSLININPLRHTHAQTFVQTHIYAHTHSC